MGALELSEGLTLADRDINEDWERYKERYFRRLKRWQKKNYSERTATQIDEEVSIFVREAEEKARKILLKRKPLLEKLAKELVEKETIEKAEFERIVGIKKTTKLKVERA